MAIPTRNEFLQYVKAFNEKDFEVQHSFYHPNVELLLPAEENEPVLKGSGEIANHYERIFGHYQERLIPIEIMTSDSRLFFLMETLFRATKPVTVGIGRRSWEPDDLGRLTVWALYEFEDGKMKKIMCNQEKFEFFGKTKTFDQGLQESHARSSPNLLGLLA